MRGNRDGRPATRDTPLPQVGNADPVESCLELEGRAQCKPLPSAYLGPTPRDPAKFLARRVAALRVPVARRSGRRPAHAGSRTSWRGTPRGTSTRRAARGWGG